MQTRGYIISRIKGLIKANNKDAFITDRFVYSIIRKYTPFLMKREDGKNNLMKFEGLFQVFPYVELIDSNRIEAKCIDIPVNCTIKRTKDKLPFSMEGYYGPLIRSITSISGPAINPQDEQPIYLTTSSSYSRKVRVKTSKYDKKKYAWYTDGHLYFPNLEWDAVRIEAIPNDTFDQGCGTDYCKSMQELPFRVPEYLFGELESFVMKDFGIPAQIPSDPVDDKQNIYR